jgi:hypothetical protein
MDEKVNYELVLKISKESMNEKVRKQKTYGTVK